MIKLITATGTYNMKKRGLPTVISGGKECALDTHELILWSILAFRILTYQEARAEFYRMERELHLLNDLDFDHYLNRLTERRLVASGTDECGIDALYDLLGRLYVAKVPAGPLMQTAAMIKLLFLRKITWKDALSSIREPKLEPGERQILSLVRSQLLSTAELVQCYRKGCDSIRSNARLMELVYADDSADFLTLIADGRTTDARYPVLEAVANLYFKQRVTFEIL